MKNILNSPPEIYTDMGRFSMAAKHHQTCAEIYESDLIDLTKALENYERVRRSLNSE